MRWVRPIATQQASERTSVHGRPRARKLTAEANDRAQRGMLKLLSQIARA